jgi:hypothetical protein
MRKFTKLFFAASIGITTVAAVSIQATPAAAFTQIGEDMGKCAQKAHFKDKMCACKDSACAQKLGSIGAKKNGPAAAAPKANGVNNKNR